MSAEERESVAPRLLGGLGVADVRAVVGGEGVLGVVDVELVVLGGASTCSEMLREAMSIIHRLRVRADMTIAMSLEKSSFRYEFSSVDVVHAGTDTYLLSDRIRAVAASRILEDLKPLG